MILFVSLSVSILTLLLFSSYLNLRRSRITSARQRSFSHFMGGDSNELFSESRKAFGSGLNYTRASKTSRKIEQMDEILQSSRINLTFTQWISLFGIFSLALAAMLSLLGANLIIGIAIGLAISFLTLRLYLNNLENRKVRSFQKDLPDFLTILASSLRSGLPLFQSIESISKNGNTELYRQMRRASSEMVVGVEPESALTELANRTQSEEMKFVVIGLSIQRETGGNLVEILDSVAETIRGREAIAREVESLSAESRLSAWLLVALPILVFIFFFFTRRDYVRLLWTTLIGTILLISMFILMILGAFWIRKIVKIKK